MGRGKTLRPELRVRIAADAVGVKYSKHSWFLANHDGTTGKKNFFVQKDRIAEAKSLCIRPLQLTV